jgi:hypothetical protein
MKGSSKAEATQIAVLTELQKMCVHLPPTPKSCKLQECPKRVSYASLGGIVFTNVQMTSEFSKEEYSLVSRPIHPRWHSLSSRNLMREILYA